MKKSLALVCALFLVLAANAQEKMDTTIISRIKSEALNKSQVMDILFWLTDANGPRLTNSAGYKSAANYAKNSLTKWGVSNAHFENWGMFEPGWQLKHYTLNMQAPYFTSLNAFPNAWSASIKGIQKAELVYIDVSSKEQLNNYKGKLAGKVVLMDKLFSFDRRTDEEFPSPAHRLSHSELINLTDERVEHQPPFSMDSLSLAKYEFCQKEKPLAILIPSYTGKDGVVFSDLNYYINHNSLDFDKYYHKDLPPQFMLSREWWASLHRMLKAKIPIQLEVGLETVITPAEEGFNVIAEIPGTDLKDEIVMIGAHLDSWHSATGTTDNAVGSAVCLEVMRIIKELGLQPRRTIRIGLWGGEEQGLFGSAGYVKQHIAERTDKGGIWNPVKWDSVILKNEYEKFSAYFNMDNGTGQFRGIYLQRNSQLRGLFKDWLKPFHSWSISTITDRNTGGTDHECFDAYNIPAFQFIQDPIDYGTKTHHSDLDVYDKALPLDLKRNVAVMASFAWLAANRDQRLERKPTKKP